MLTDRDEDGTWSVTLAAHRADRCYQLRLEHVLPRTGHMFRFTHPVTYSQHIADFLAARLAGNLNEKAKLFGEIGVYPKIIDFNDRYAVVSAGAKILAADNVSFDVFGGRAFAKSAPYDWTFGLGVSTRF